MLTSRPTTPVFWITTGSVGSALLTVISFRVIGDIAGAEGIGSALLLYGLVLLLSGLVSGPVSQAVGKFYFDDNSKCGRGQLWYSSLGIIAIGFNVGVLALIGLLVCDWIDGWSTVLLLILALAVELVRPLGVTWLYSESRFREVALSQILDGTLRPVFAILAAEKLSSSINLVLLAYSSAGFISVVLLLFFVMPGMRLMKPNYDQILRIWHYGAPLIVNGMVGWLSSAGDRYLVAAAIDARAAGIYIVATAFGGRLSLMVGNIMQVYYRPRLYAFTSNSDLDQVRAICKEWLGRYLIISALILVGLLVGMPLIQEYLIAAELRSGSGPIIIISFLAIGAVVIGYIPQRINYAFERTDRVAQVEVIGLLVTVPAMLLLGRHFGLLGAAIGLLFSGSIRMLASFVSAGMTMREAASNQ